MATSFLVDLDGSFLLVEPGTILLVEGDPPVFAFKTVGVATRMSRVAVRGMQVPVHVAARVNQMAVSALGRVVPGGTASRRIRVGGL